MKTVVTFLLSIVFAVNAYAAEPADKKLAMEYLKVSQFEQMIDATIVAVPRSRNTQRENEAVKAGKPPKGFRSMDTVWVSGTLKTLRSDSYMGASGYRMDAVVVERYLEPK